MRQIRVKEIKQKDRYHFTLLWSDGRKCSYRLSDLQERCPCVLCAETREKQAPLSVKRDVMALRIASVGRYALRVEFTSGCSKGIYSFSYLHALAEGKR